jgi:hypothetical protein
MSIQGSAERVLDSVLPHEITHMIYASHFRRPLPRWADEGGATSVEHASERNKQRVMLGQFLRSGRGIPFDKLFAMTEYPADVLPLYAEGYSAAEYLIQLGGRRRYIAFLDDALPGGDWAGALKKNYGISGLREMQNNWLAWVKQGQPLKQVPTVPASPEMLAAGGNAPQRNPTAMPNREKTASSPMPTSIAAAKHSDVPYTPGSTIAVSRFSITSTGWRSSVKEPPSATQVAVSAPPMNSDPYRTTVTRPQPLEAPVQTTIWR